MKEFAPFRLDTVNQCLWRRRDKGDDERILLTPKAFAVLRYMVEHAGRLVTEDELLEAVWPDTFVQPQAVKSQLFDVRRALGDNPKTPLFIETLPKRGYRFIAAVNESRAAALAVPSKSAQNTLVGRDRELAELGACLRTTLVGQRQIVLVTGEPGIGKSALIDAFQDRSASDVPGIRIARGQCVEGYGGKEAYYPMLEALGQLCLGSEADFVVQTLAAQAPTWLVQFPALVKPEHRELLPREILGATRERMLREIGEALETITSRTPLLLIFEDLQWVDHSTVDLLSALARGRASAKLMLIVTYRPVDLVLSNHPFKGLKQDLLVHQLCREIALEPLREAEVTEYLTARSSETSLPAGLAWFIHRHSEGNPLFMVAALDHMTQRGLISRENGSWQLRVALEEVALEVPETLREMIEAQIERLSADEQRALEVASVTGAAFSTGVSAAATNFNPEDFEDLCERLSRRHHIVRSAASQQFPDGSVSPRYEFVHALYREVFYRRQGLGRRAKLHRRIGERLESLYSGRLSEIAPELAHHFEEGSDWPRAVKYLRLAAETTRRRFAHPEAAVLLRHALELASKLPEAERAAAETETLEKLAMTYAASYDPRALETYEALGARAAHHGLIDVEVRALIGLAFPTSLTSSQRGLDLVDRALRLSARQEYPLMRARTRARGFFWRLWAGGWNPRDAREFHSAFAEIRRAGDRRMLAPHLIDYSFIQWSSSEYREAHRSAVESFVIAAEGSEENPYLSPAYPKSHLASHFAAQAILPWSLLFLGEWGEALREIEAGMTMVGKAGDPRNLQRLRYNQAWIHLNAMDFAGVLAICEPVLPTAGDPASVSQVRFCLVLAGLAETALGNHARALERLLTARSEMDGQMVMLDWYWRMLLESGLTEVWLAKGDLVQARPQAERFLEVTLATTERTWQALAWEANARVAVGEGDVPRAQDCIVKALSTMEGFEVPLAAWRVRATAADLAQRAGDEELAAHNRELSRATILKLANSLPAEEPLRNIFLSAPSVSKVLGNAERSSHIRSSRPPASTTSTVVSVGDGKRRTCSVEHSGPIMFRESP
jgi:DNA-binding winged helix-turn-helix (wHTH) protein